MTGIMGHFSFAGMPYAEAERSLRCFVEQVMPELKRWDARAGAGARRGGRRLAGQRSRRDM